MRTEQEKTNLQKISDFADKSCQFSFELWDFKKNRLTNKGASPTLPPSSGLYSFQNTVYHVAVRRTKRYKSAVKFSVKYLNSTKSLNGVKICFFLI